MVSIYVSFRDAFYTSLWNALDYSAVTFPVTTVDPVLDVRVPRDDFHNHEDEHIYQWCEYLLLCPLTALPSSSHPILYVYLNNEIVELIVLDQTILTSSKTLPWDYRL